VCFPGKSLDHFERTMTAPMTSPPPLRRCFGSSVVCRWIRCRTPTSFAWSWRWSLAVFGAFLLLCLSLLYFVHLHLDCTSRRLVDALSPFFSGGCFATIIVLVVDSLGRMLYRLDCVGRVDAWSFLSLVTFASLTRLHLLAGSCLVVSRFVGSREFPHCCSCWIACHLLSGAL
jgi:hypothetical protein